VLPNSTDLDERRALNIVEELALAANMPVPPLYVLPDERGINAFAAGVSPADAVVAVTRGALLQLRRDELSGVIGHEFSHILNGDMRLGIRLAALLKGITFIGDVGHFMLRSGTYSRARSGSSNSSRSPALPMIGLGLLVIGWLGALAASFIKSAISRQKEYLADASAVQFTRDNRGIADALKVIGGFLPGTLVHAARASEMSHIFFGDVQHRLWQGFATHPPLPARIQRLDPEWDGKFIAREERRDALDPRSVGYGATGMNRETLVAAAAASLGGAAIATREDADFSTNPEPESTAPQPARECTASQDGGAVHNPASAEQDDPESPAAPIDPALASAASEPLSATALALAMLVAREEDSAEALQVIEAEGVRGQAAMVRELLPAVRALCPGERFPLLSTAMPALKGLSTPQYRQFKSTLLQVIRADGRTDLFEWCLFQLLRHYLDPEYLRVEASKPRYPRLARVRAPLRVVLSVLAHQGEGSSNRAFTVATQALDLPQLTLAPREDCSVAAFGKAVQELADCYPLLKPRILKAMALAAADDGRVSAVEREIVAAVAAVMDCPLPDDLAL